MADTKAAPPLGRMDRVYHLDAHHRFFAALGTGILAFIFTPWHWHWTTRILAAWDAYSLCVLILAWITLGKADPAEVRRTACLQDSSRNTIFGFVLVAACASILAVAAELGTAKGLDRAHLGGHIIFSLLTVVSSWCLVHTIFTLRYAHDYYGEGEGGEHYGGLDFPNEDSPDYLDFAYFSFVIGMTSQTSDVNITAQPIRRLALLHGLIAFIFNLSIVGLCINIISGLF